MKVSSFKDDRIACVGGLRTSRRPRKQGPVNQRDPSSYEHREGGEYAQGLHGSAPHGALEVREELGTAPISNPEAIANG